MPRPYWPARALLALALAVVLLHSLVTGLAASRGEAFGSMRFASKRASVPNASPLLYVDAGHTGPELGTRAAPWRSISQALAEAQAKDTILVAAGVYTENLTIDHDLTLWGGFAAASSPISWTRPVSTSTSAIDGASQGPALRVLGPATVHLGGLEIRHGRAAQGGGVVVQAATLTLAHSIVASNVASDRGGGLFAVGSTLAATHTHFHANTAMDWGGGLYLLHSFVSLSQVRITSNQAMWEGGGGLYVDQSSLYLHHSTIAGNRAECCGGGIGAMGAVLNLQTNQISANRVNPQSALGGGMYVLDSVARLDANTVMGNRALAGAGVSLGCRGINPDSCPYIITNHFIAANAGGGLLLHGGQVLNNTIRDNPANDYGEYGYGILLSSAARPGVVLIANNIVAGNAIGVGRIGPSLHFWNEPGPAPLLAANNVWGNTVADYDAVTPGASDLSVDPLLMSMAQGGHRLQSDSPCIDAGHNQWAARADLSGHLRPADGDGDGVARVDIGADEFWPDTTPAPATLIHLPLQFRP